MGTLSPDEIARGSPIALDTMPWIYFLERHPVYFGPGRRLFERIEAGELVASSSALVFAELLVPAYRAGDDVLAGSIRRLLCGFPHFEILDLTPGLSAAAARLRSRYGLRPPDAIHVATALEAGARTIVTNDRHYDRVSEDLEVWWFDRRG